MSWHFSVYPMSWHLRRKPQEPWTNNEPAREAGDRPRGSNMNSGSRHSAVARLRGLANFPCGVPGAYAPGFTLPPAFAGLTTLRSNSLAPQSAPPEPLSNPPNLRPNSLDSRSNPLGSQSDSIDLLANSPPFRSNSLDPRSNSLDLRSKSLDLRSNSIDLRSKSIKLQLKRVDLQPKRTRFEPKPLAFRAFLIGIQQKACFLARKRYTPAP